MNNRIKTVVECLSHRWTLFSSQNFDDAMNKIENARLKSCILFFLSFLSFCPCLRVIVIVVVLLLLVRQFTFHQLDFNRPSFVGKYIIEYAKLRFDQWYHLASIELNEETRWSDSMFVLINLHLFVVVARRLTIESRYIFFFSFQLFIAS